MGIKNIKKILPDSVGVKKNMYDLRGQNIIIDTNNLLYKVVYQYQKTSNARDHYLNSLATFARKLISGGNTPIFVFDGIAEDIKSEELIIRAKAKDSARERANARLLAAEDKQRVEHQIIKVDNPADLIDLVDNFPSLQVESTAQALNTGPVELSNEHINACKLMFDYAGIPYIQAKSEADPLCAYLAKQENALCMSEDTDMMAYGVPKVMRRYKINSGEFLEFNNEEVCKYLKISREKLADLCTLCGTDYGGVKNVGPITARNMIQKHKNIEECIAELDELNKKRKNKFEVGDYDYIRVRNIFRGANDEYSAVGHDHTLSAPREFDEFATEIKSVMADCRAEYYCEIAKLIAARQ